MELQDVRRAANMVTRVDDLNERIKYLDQLVRILASGKHKSILRMDITCLETKEEREYQEAKKQAGETEMERYGREVMEVQKNLNSMHPHAIINPDKNENKHHPEDHHLELKLADVMGIQVLAVVLDCWVQEKKTILEALTKLGVKYESDNRTEQ